MGPWAREAVEYSIQLLKFFVTKMEEERRLAGHGAERGPAELNKRSHEVNCGLDLDMEVVDEKDIYVDITHDDQSVKALRLTRIKGAKPAKLAAFVNDYVARNNVHHMWHALCPPVDRYGVRPRSACNERQKILKGRQPRKVCLRGSQIILSVEPCRVTIAKFQSA